MSDLCHACGRPVTDDPRLLICVHCGSNWAQLRDLDGKEGALILDADGGVTGYRGSPWCGHCGGPMIAKSGDGTHEEASDDR